MKISEGLRELKQNKIKIVDLQKLIAKHCAHLDISNTEYSDPKQQIRDWLNAVRDLGKRNIQLQLAIQKTNLAVQVAIKLGENTITQPIAYWVQRRREYAAIELAAWQKLTDKGHLEKQRINTGREGEHRDVILIRNFDPKERDIMLSILKHEASKGGIIDTTLEVVNATTDLIGLE